MSYEVLERKIECLTVKQQQSVFDFVNFLLSQNDGEAAPKARRTPGGLTGKFYMSPDFDETPDCFKDYI